MRFEHEVGGSGPPVLMLHGAQDPHPGDLVRDSLAPHLGSLEYVELERCGHTGTTTVQIGTLTIIGSLTDTGTIVGDVATTSGGTQPGDGFTVTGNYAAGDKFAQMYELEMALRLGADAVVCMAFPGSDDEEVGLRKLVAMVNEAEKVGMPVIAESIPGSWGKTVPWDAEHLSQAARICIEVGADAIKTPATEDLAEMPTLIDNCEAPVFILGGPKKDSEDEAVQYAADVVAAGASGIAFGRNTWGSSDPKAMAARLHAAVHGA